MKVSKNFIVQEFVPIEIWKKYGESSIRFVNPILVCIAQGVHDFYDKSVIINNWLWDGKYNYSGFRPPDCIIGAPLSAHKRMAAIDTKVKGVLSNQVQKDVLNHQAYFMKIGVTTMELNTDGWTHLGCEWWNLDDIKTIKT